MLNACHLSPDTVNQTGPLIYHYVEFFIWIVCYMPIGSSCNYIMVIIDQSYAAIPFVVTAYPDLWASPAYQCHYVAKCEVLICLKEITACVISPEVIMQHQWISVCVYYLIILFFVSYTTMRSWCAWAFCLIYFYFVCLLNKNFTLSMYGLYIIWGLSISLYHDVNSKPHWSVAYSPWSGHNFSSYWAWAAFSCSCLLGILPAVMQSGWVIVCNIPAAGPLALLNRGNMISFPPVTHCFLSLIHMCSEICCVWPRYSIVFHLLCLHKNVL